jgi:hypothetical protein
LTAKFCDIFGDKELCFLANSHDAVLCPQSWISLKARETAAIGRELLGGNGILADFLVAKVFMLNSLLRSLLLDT